MKKIYVMVVPLIIYMFTFPVAGEYNISENNQSMKKSITYRIAIDQYHGFYRAYYANVSGKTIQVPYNGTLTL